MSYAAVLSASRQPTDGRQLTGVQREHHNILAPHYGGGGRMGGWTSEDMYSKRVSALPIIFLWRRRIKSVPLPYPLPVSHKAILKSCFGYFIGPCGGWNPRTVEKKTPQLHWWLHVLYISLFPDFMCQSITIAQRIKSSSVYHTSIIRISLQPVDRDYI
jgi:hypothetical protein